MNTITTITAFAWGYSNRSGSSTRFLLVDRVLFSIHTASGHRPSLGVDEAPTVEFAHTFATNLTAAYDYGEWEFLGSVWTYDITQDDFDGLRWLARHDEPRALDRIEDLFARITRAGEQH